MSQHQSITIATPPEPEGTSNNRTQRTSNNDSNNDDDDTRTIQNNVEEEITVKKEEKEIERLSLQHMDSDQKTATIKKLPLTTTDKPWYNIELINIHKKEHILDPRDYSMLKKSLILAVVALSATMYVLFILSFDPNFECLLW